jgi:hypothetical protein
VPWCTACDRFLSPSSVTTEGDCPRCGAAVDPGRARPAASAPAAAPDTDSYVPDLEPVPWHLKLLAGAVALYLGWRAFQGIEWIVHRF